MAECGTRSTYLSAIPRRRTRIRMSPAGSDLVRAGSIESYCLSVAVLHPPVLHRVPCGTLCLASLRGAEHTLGDIMKRSICSPLLLLAMTLCGLAPLSCQTSGTAPGEDAGLPTGQSVDMAMESSAGGDLAKPMLLLTSASPIRGPSSGGITVTLSGQLFQPGASVIVGGVAVSNVNVVSSSTLTLTLPAQLGKQGPIPITVRNPDGTTSTRSDIFSYYSSGAISFNKSVVVNGVWDLASDINQDGNVDLVALAGSTAMVGILPGNGDGTFGVAKSASLSRQSGLTFGIPNVVPVTSDAKPDYVDLASDGYLQIYPGNGDFTFGSPVRSLAGNGSKTLYGPQFGDVNGDGRVDALVSVDDNSFNILLGKGDGSFQSPKPGFFINPISQINGFCPPLLVDVNKDGKQDLISYAPGPEIISVYPSKGDGTFGPAVSYNSRCHALGTGDTNADGYPDLIVYYHDGFRINTAQFFVMLGSATGPFQRLNNNEYAPTGVFRLVYPDFDGNGTSDMMGEVSGVTGDIGQWTGKSDGTFSLSLLSGYRNPIVADFDKDQRTDVLLTIKGMSTSAVLLNTTQ